ncbi:DUF3253 domain-containing protein [Oceanitalea stevensii]|uniref:4,4'-diaponeurosporenoate glycosyltransferase n=1 Tax=Oceanitalea stevensii TaxID=2763072 RepID=A0ABR8YY79_9MICO|nr:DUF3253 domain-containing protein [Oceanitalea stevensii]MBD8061010.1 DUF3253 domain-containing protein [Oceanitalea stevensii]
MHPRDETDDRPALCGVLVVVPARDEEAEIAGCLGSVATAAERVELPVVVSVVLHRCTDRTAEKVADVAREHANVHWVTVASEAETLGGARADGADAGRSHEALADLPPGAVWCASTDADSQVPPAWLAEQRVLADRGLDLVLGTVEPREDGSPSTPYWHAPHHLTEGHLGVRAANLGLRLSAYDDAGGFPDRDEGADVHLVHAVREIAGLPWTSTDRARVVTSSRRQGRSSRGFARFLTRLDVAVAAFGASPDLQDRLRSQLLQIAEERGAGKTLCPSDAAGVLDPERRRELTPLARAVASTLADEGLVVITQKGVPVDGRTAVGPVRVGLPLAEMR